MKKVARDEVLVATKGIDFVLDWSLGISMRRYTVLRALRHADNALRCHSRSRCRPPTCCYHYQAIRQFNSTGAQLNAESPSPTPRRNGGEQNKRSGPKSGGWGSTPTFGRNSSLTAQELKLRDSLVASRSAKSPRNASKTTPGPDESTLGRRAPERTGQDRPRFSRDSGPQRSNGHRNPHMNQRTPRGGGEHPWSGYTVPLGPKMRSLGPQPSPSGPTTSHPTQWGERPGTWRNEPRNHPGSYRRRQDTQYTGQHQGDIHHQPRQEFKPQVHRESKFTGFRKIVPERDPEPIDRRFNGEEDTTSKEPALPPGIVIEEPDSEIGAGGMDGLERNPASVDRKKPKKGRRKKGVEDDEMEGFDEWQDRRRKKKDKSKEKEVKPTPILLPDFISVTNLADALGVRQERFLRRIQDMGFEEATYDHVLDAETAGLIASEFNFEAMFDTGSDDLVAAPAPTDNSALSPRPPVVTIMGHVDHGKTTILDWLRKSSVVVSEHGGITQHIGAFSVMMPSGKLITFLDTPGHAAFLDMRRRGADITDIVILVVAGDDSVKPQTIEAIKHAKQAQVPIIVAINKVDKPDINTERVKQDLARHNVSVEDFGGDVQAIPVSGKTGQGMVELEEATLTLSEMLDFRGDPVGNVEGWVIEAATQKSGRVATVLVRRGTLRPGDVIVAGKTWAKVRSLKNEAGVQVNEATPGTPVSVDGWKEQPIAGDEVLQAEDMQRAKDVVELRTDKEDMQKLGGHMAEINESRRQEREKRERQRAAEEEDSPFEGQAVEDTGSGVIPVIVKADVSGSVEAIVNSIASVGNNEVHAQVLRSGVGPVSEFDVKHAATAKGVVVTFNQQVDPNISKQAIAGGVDILNHTIIYELIDDMKARLGDRLPPKITHRVLGEAEIAQIFEISLKRRQKALIAGSKVKNGLIGRSHKVKVFRGDEVIYDGTLSSLKNVKKDVDEMRKGTECGIGFEDWGDFQIGDTVQTYEEISEKRTL